MSPSVAAAVTKPTTRPGKAPAHVRSKPIASPPSACLIVFGLDDKDRPHASRFGEVDMELARKAAGLMGMTAVEVTTDILQELAAQLPAGRVFASGKAFVPFVKGELYRQLAACSPIAATEPTEGRTKPASAPQKAAEGVRAAGAAQPAKTTANAPSAAPESNSDTAAEGSAEPDQQNGWSAIKAGDLVLAYDDPEGGWYEARVLEIRSDLFTLKWCEWPELGRIVRRPEHIALLHPAYIAAFT